ncbi:hypothetical protein ACJ6WE_40110 [Streptomyces sp. MMS24-I31]|uniref:hypothetical protein n=1 Tax=Streptomyces sp. MMS24-I31 TaxID=3351563 RepID=UPI0038969DB9
MSEYDEDSAGESLRKAAELLPDDDADDGAEAAQQAVQEALQALPGTPQPGWTPEQETQIQAMVTELRTVRQLARPDAGWLRRKRQMRARNRYVDLAMFSDPALVDEAELRMWKHHMTVALLLEFAVSAMQRDDVQAAVSRLAIVHAATYEDLKEFKQKMADRQESTGRP